MKVMPARRVTSVKPASGIAVTAPGGGARDSDSGATDWGAGVLRSSKKESPATSAPTNRRTIRDRRRARPMAASSAGGGVSFAAGMLEFGFGRVNQSQAGLTRTGMRG